MTRTLQETGATNGGGWEFGVGFLYDAGGGNDTYTAGNEGTNGGGSSGVGFLYDAGGGDDTYTAVSGGTNGGGDLGVGFLYDAGGGDDTYTAASRGTNGGGALGFLHDAGGIDRYEDWGYVCDNRDVGDCTLVPKELAGALVDNNLWHPRSEWYNILGTKMVDLFDDPPLAVPPDSGFEQREVLNVDNETILPGFGTDPVPLPPTDVDGFETPDYPGTGPVDPRIGYLRVYDDQSPGGEQFLCVGLLLNATEDPEEEEVLCVNRVLLGPADSLVERGTFPLGFVPGTDPMEIPDVPDLNEGALGEVPGQETSEFTASASAVYRYDPDRLFSTIIVLGQEVFAPFGPGDDDWFLGSEGAKAGLEVSVALYEDGENVGSQTLWVPFVGQVIAAMEASAGTGS